MDIEKTKDALVAKLEGHIDAGSAPQMEDELTFFASANAQLPLVLDAAALDYISSAGLRVIMRLLRTHHAGVSVTNASPEVYDVFEMTGFTDMMDIGRALREVSVEGLEVLGKGGVGTVYRLDSDTIVKVYEPGYGLERITRERDLARAAFVAGLPTTIAYDVVRVGDAFGVVYELVRSDTLARTIMADHDRIESYVDAYVELARTLHTTHVDTSAFSDVHEALHDQADHLDPWCTQEEISALHRIVEAIPHVDTIAHNDLHPGNIMVQDGELVLIDMDTAALAPPVVDLAATFRDTVAAPASGSRHEAEFADYYKRLGLLCSLNAVFTPGAGAESAVSHAESLMENVLRPQVLPNEETIKGLLQTM